MKRYLLFFSILFCFWAGVPALGQTVQGVVYDESSQPLPFAFVYLKSNPQMHAFTGSDGAFLLNPQGEKWKDEDVIIFSFIGYKTVEQKIKDIDINSTLSVRLAEQPIMLEGTIVNAKVSKKIKNAVKLNFIQKFKEQLEKDFPVVNTEYKVVSNLQVIKEETVLIANEMIGNISEFQQIRPTGDDSDTTRDSIDIKVISIKNYTDARLKEGLKKLIDQNHENALAADKKGSKKQSDATVNIERITKDTSEASINERSMKLHKMLWGSGANIKDMIDEMDMDKLKNWNITYTNENAILTYKEKKGLLGIIRFESMIHFILDIDTYSVERISQSTEIELNIPFGHKLDKETLGLLNIFNVGGEDIEKFRLKHIYGDLKQNVLYINTDNGKFADEKNLDANISLIDNKDHALNYNAKALAKVLSFSIIK